MRAYRGADGRLAQAENRHAELLARRERCKQELERQRSLTLQAVERIASVLVLPHPVSEAMDIRRLRASPETEATAMRVVMEYERAQDRQVYDVHEKNLGYDITSLDLNSGELRLIKVNGLADATGTILLTPNERRVAEDRRDCYWLYVVTNCLPAAPNAAQAGKPDGGYKRVLFEEFIDPADVTFESDVFLLLKNKAKTLKAAPELETGAGPAQEPTPEPVPSRETEPKPEPPAYAAGREPSPGAATRAYRIHGNIPPEVWNRLGTRILPKLRSAVPAGRQGSELKIGSEFLVTVEAGVAESFQTDLKQMLEDIGLADRVRIEQA